MAYAIMRCKKINKMGNLAASLQHCFRERETLNADAEKTPYNIHMIDVDTTSKAMGTLRQMLPDKRRKDAVVAVEYVMTASPDWWKTATAQQQYDFFKHSLEWLKNKYGENRIFTATIHQDETTPHLSAFVVPLTQDGRLSAKEFIGNKKQMQDDQTTFADKVQHLGIERGIQGSKAKHQRVKTFYGEISEVREPYIQIQSQELKPKVLKKGIFTSTIENETNIAERLTNKVRDEYQDVIKTAVQARTATVKKKEVENTNKSIVAFIQPIYGLIKQLNQNSLSTFFYHASEFAKKLIQKQKEQEIIEAEKQKAMQIAKQQQQERIRQEKARIQLQNYKNKKDRGGIEY